MISVSVCLYFCLSVRSHSSKTTRPNSTKLLYLLSMAVARSYTDGDAIYYVLPVLRMTSCFHIMVAMARITDDTYVSSSSPGGDTRAKYAISDCILSSNCREDPKYTGTVR